MSILLGVGGLHRKREATSERVPNGPMSSKSVGPGPWPKEQYLCMFIMSLQSFLIEHLDV